MRLDQKLSGDKNEAFHVGVSGWMGRAGGDGVVSQAPLYQRVTGLTVRGDRDGGGKHSWQVKGHTPHFLPQGMMGLEECDEEGGVRGKGRNAAPAFFQSSPPILQLLFSFPLLLRVRRVPCTSSSSSDASLNPFSHMHRSSELFWTFPGELYARTRALPSLGLKVKQSNVQNPWNGQSRSRGVS